MVQNQGENCGYYGRKRFITKDIDKIQSFTLNKNNLQEKPKIYNIISNENDPVDVYRIKRQNKLHKEIEYRERYRTHQYIKLISSNNWKHL